MCLPFSPAFSLIAAPRVACPAAAKVTDLSITATTGERSAEHAHAEKASARRRGMRGGRRRPRWLFSEDGEKEERERPGRPALFEEPRC